MSRRLQIMTKASTSGWVLMGRRWMLSGAILMAGMLGSTNAISGVIFSDDFETGDLSHSVGGAKWTDSVRTGVSNSVAKSGSYSLAFKYPGVPDGEDSFSEQRYYLGGNYPELWIKYDLYIPANYRHRTQSGSANNKAFAYAWSGTYQDLTGPLLGFNFWPDGTGESRGSQWFRSPLLPSGRHIWPDDSRWIDPRVIKLTDRGKWMQVMIHFKYATSSNDNGVVELWITPQGGERKLMYSERHGDFYVPGQPGFEAGYLLGWANSGFDEDTTLYIDNIVFSTDPIGVNPPAAPLAQ